MYDILFDLDGTIIDSSKCIFTAYTELFKELGLEVPESSKMRTFIGPPLKYIMKDYFPPEDMPELIKRYRAIYSTIDLATHNKLYDGVIEMLDEIKKTGRKVYIATTKHEKTAKTIMNIFGVEKYLDGVYGSIDAIGRSYKKDVLEALLKEEGLDKDNVILIGDTHFDAEGADQVGIKTGIVTYGFLEEERLKPYKVEFFADTPQEVAKIIKERY